MRLDISKIKILCREWFQISKNYMTRIIPCDGALLDSAYSGIVANMIQLSAE